VDSRDDGFAEAILHGGEPDETARPAGREQGYDDDAQSGEQTERVVQVALGDLVREQEDADGAQPADEQLSGTVVVVRAERFAQK
jgi:hypothetical protein